MVLWLGVKSVILLKKNDGIDVGEFVSTLLGGEFVRTLVEHEVSELSEKKNLDRCG